VEVLSLAMTSVIQGLVVQVGNIRQQSDVVMVFVPDDVSCMAFCSVLLGS
jgi:hypothetical protein